METDKKQEEMLSEDLVAKAFNSLMAKMKAGTLWKCGTPEEQKRLRQEKEQ